MSVSASCVWMGGDTCLAGCGDEILLFKRQQQQRWNLRGSCCPVSGWIWHGISSPCKKCGECVIFGRNLLQSLEIVEGGNVLKWRASLGDWILDATIVSESKSGCHAVLVTFLHGVIGVVVGGELKKQFRVDGRVIYLSARVVAPSLDDITVVLGAMDARVVLCRIKEDVMTTTTLRGFVGTAYCVDVIVNDNDEVSVLCGSDDRSVTVWKMGKCVNLWGFGGRIWDVRWLNEHSVAGVGEDGTLRIWHHNNNVWESSTVIHIASGHVRQLHSCGDWIVCGSDDGSVVQVDLEHERNNASRSSLLASGFSRKSSKTPSARLLWTDGNTGDIWLVTGDAVFCGEVVVYEKFSSPVVFLGRYRQDEVVVVHKDGAVVSLQMHESNRVHVVCQVEKGVAACALDKNVLLLSQWNGSSSVLDLNNITSGPLILKPSLQNGESITCCVVDAETRCVALGTSLGSIWFFWETKSCQVHHRQAVTDLKLYGMRLYGSCRDGRIGVWDFACEGMLRVVWIGRPRSVRSPEGVEAIIIAPPLVLARVHTPEGMSVCLVSDCMDDASDVIASFPGVLPRMLCHANVVQGTHLSVAVWTKDGLTVSKCSLDKRRVSSVRKGGHADVVVCAAAHGRCLLTSSDDGRWALWDEHWQAGARIWRKTGGSVRALGWCSSGTEFWVSSSNELQKWSALDGVMISSLQFSFDQEIEVRRIMWLLVVDEERVVLGDSAGFVHLVVENTLQRSVRVDGFCLQCACIVSDSLVAIASSSGSICMLSLADLNIRDSQAVSRTSFHCISRNAAGLLAAGDDPNRVWCKPSGTSLWKELSLSSFPHAASIVGLSSFMIDEHAFHLLTLSRDQSVSLWRVSLDSPAWSVAHVRRTAVPISHASAFQATRNENGFVVVAGGANGMHILNIFE